MALIAAAFLYLNRVDPDCGTTFSWVTRAMGPWFGWLGGWAIMMTGVLIVGSLADVGVRFGLYGVGELVRSDALVEAGDNAWIRMPAAIVLVLVMTWICVLGTDVSARLQNLLIIVQVVSLLVFAVVAIVRAARGDSPLDEITPSHRLAQPVRCRRRRAELGPAARGLRLLGLGVGGQPQRGDDRRRQARPGARRCCRPSCCW